MVPSASEITRRRLTAATVLRLGAAGVAHTALIPLIVMVVEMIEGYSMNSFSRWGPFVVPIAIIWAVSGTVWALAPWIARLMIRVPRYSSCPYCQTKLEGLATPACLECGYTLTREFLTTPAERRDADPATTSLHADTVWLRQIATLVIRLVCGAFVPVSAVVAFIFAVEAIESPRRNSWTPVFAWAFVGVFCLAAMLFASTLSILMVPGRKRFGGDEPAVAHAPASSANTHANTHANPHAGPPADLPTDPSTSANPGRTAP